MHYNVSFMELKKPHWERLMLVQLRNPTGPALEVHDRNLQRLRSRKQARRSKRILQALNTRYSTTLTASGNSFTNHMLKRADIIRPIYQTGRVGKIEEAIRSCSRHSKEEKRASEACAAFHFTRLAIDIYQGHRERLDRTATTLFDTVTSGYCKSSGYNHLRLL